MPMGLIGDESDSSAPAEAMWYDGDDEGRSYRVTRLMSNGPASEEALRRLKEGKGTRALHAEILDHHHEDVDQVAMGQVTKTLVLRTPYSYILRLTHYYA